MCVIRREKLLQRIRRCDPNLTLVEIATALDPIASAHRITGSHFIWQLPGGAIVIPRSKSGKVKLVYIRQLAVRLEALDREGGTK